MDELGQVSSVSLESQLTPVELHAADDIGRA